MQALVGLQPNAHFGKKRDVDFSGWSALLKMLWLGLVLSGDPFWALITEHKFFNQKPDLKHLAPQNRLRLLSP